MVTKKSTKKSTTRSTTKSAKKSPSISVSASFDNVDAIKMGKSQKQHCSNHKFTGSCIYFLGFVGAAIYYISIATGFWNGVWGVIKALVWPAILVFKLFMNLG